MTDVVTDVREAMESNPGDAISRNVKLLLVGTSYPLDLKDWKGLFIRHMADALGRHNDVHVHLWAPPGDLGSGVRRCSLESEDAWLRRLMQSGGIAHQLRTARVKGPLEAIRLLYFLHRLYRRVDFAEVLHVNWLQNAIPLPSDRRPLLVTVLGTDMQLLRLPFMRSLLRRVFQGRRVMICPNADWMVPGLREAFSDVATIEFVPFGIEPRWYDVKRVPVEPRKWLVITRLTRDKLGDLFSACESLFNSGDRELHLIGPMQEEISIPSWVRYHGPAGPDSLREQWFPSATGLITLSRHAEGRPQVMLEAMAAGLPIVASDIEAHRSFVEHTETGYLVGPHGTVGDAIAALECYETNLKTGQAARRWAKREVGTWDDCAERYVSRYRALIDQDLHG